MSHESPLRLFSLEFHQLWRWRDSLVTALYTLLLSQSRRSGFSAVCASRVPSCAELRHEVITIGSRFTAVSVAAPIDNNLPRPANNSKRQEHGSRAQGLPQFRSEIFEQW